MTKNKFIIILFLILMTAQAYAFTSLTLAKATIAATIKANGTCLRYKMPTRFCIWLSPEAGRTFTPMLDHYLPDVVVIVYRNNNENPWSEAKLLVDKIPSEAQKMIFPNVGSGNHPFLNQRDQQVIFKEADVIGNPGLSLLPHYFKYLLLPSTTIPAIPYFQSMLDSYLWRGFMPQAAAEEAAAVVLGHLHKVGTGITDWGSVYPHEGTVQGNNDAKASMVIAQRAADLLTNKKPYGHIRRSLRTSCGEHCKIAPIKENSEDTLFQMVYPNAQADCITFGKEDLYKNSMLSEDGAYAWIVWRHYEGCADGDGLFIGVTP